MGSVLNLLSFFFAFWWTPVHIILIKTVHLSYITFEHWRQLQTKQSNTFFMALISLIYNTVHVNMCSFVNQQRHCLTVDSRNKSIQSTVVTCNDKLDVITFVLAKEVF